MDLAFRTMIEWLKPAHVLALVPIDSFEAGRGTLIWQQISKIARLLPAYGSPLSAGHEATRDVACKWKVGVTKCDKDFIKSANIKFKNAQKYLEDLEPQLKGNIININYCMFGDELSAVKLKNLVLEDTHTPVKAHAELAQEVKNCFPTAAALEDLKRESWWRRLVRVGSGEQPIDYPECLISDCLNPVDTDWLQRILSTFEFLETYLCDSDKNEPEAFSGGAEDWSTAQQNIKLSHKKMQDHVLAIKTDSDNLMRFNILS